MKPRLQSAVPLVLCTRALRLPGAQQGQTVTLHSDPETVGVMIQLGLRLCTTMTSVPVGSGGTLAECLCTNSDFIKPALGRALGPGCAAAGG